MKKMKKLLSVLMAVTMTLPIVACSNPADGSSSSGNETSKAEETTTAGADKTYKIGYTVQDLTNPIWADTAEECKKIAADLGMQITVLDCKANAATQISQMENFIQDKVDAIVINPADATALADVIKKAMDGGIKILSYDVKMDTCTAQYLVDNYELGTTIGTQAAKWINEKLGGKAEVAVIDYPLIPDIIARAQGIIDAIKKDAPNAQIVAQASAATASDGMKNTENFLQAHPNIKVIASIGDGGAIGANEAIKSAGKNTEDFGIFSADATEEAMSKIANNESIRMTVQLDTPRGKAEDIMDIVEKMVKGEDFEQTIYTSQIPVDASNINEYYKP